MTVTDTEAFEAIVRHHRQLLEDVTGAGAELAGAVAEGGSYERHAAELVAVIAEEVLPHALAEEASIYAAASGFTELAQLVTQMSGEHAELAATVERIATAPDGPAAAAGAAAFQSLFARHVDKENERILPILRDDSGVSLAALLEQMHRRLVGSGTEDSTAAGPGLEDSTAAGPGLEDRLVDLLLGTADELVGSGEGDRGCRLAASTWAALRTARPDLAERVTAALHRLARAVPTAPVSLQPRHGELPATPVLDVRELAPARRHEAIFGAFDALAPQGRFVLVNDHDPKPLRYQFEAEHSGEFSWEYLERGPRTWRVRIGREPAAQAR